MKIGVVLLCNEDIVNGIVGRLAHVALSLMLEAKLGEAMPPYAQAIELPAEPLAPLTGDYESPSTWAKIEVKAGRLVGKIAGHPVTFTPTDPLKFIVDGRVADRSLITFEHDTAGKVNSFVTASGQRYARIDPAAASVPCPLWKTYVGSYGPSFIPLVISIRYGHLYAMTENLADYRLTPIDRCVFAMPPGLYADEHLVFLTGPDGKVWAANLTNMSLLRR